MLATGEQGSDRLRMLDRLYGRTTTELLDDIAVGPGMRVADIGCGISRR